jgi:hypothetical protein
MARFARTCQKATISPLPGIDAGVLTIIYDNICALHHGYVFGLPRIRHAEHMSVPLRALRTGSSGHLHQAPPIEQKLTSH